MIFFSNVYDNRVLSYTNPYPARAKVSTLCQWRCFADAHTRKLNLTGWSLCDFKDQRWQRAGGPKRLRP